jgi:sirohydrochlorin ferrochelatase
LVDIDQQPHLVSDTLRRFYAESRLVCNARLRRELGFAPLYPSYREGLAACLEVPPTREDEAVTKQTASPAPLVWWFPATLRFTRRLLLRALARLVRALMWRFWFQQRTLVVLVDNGSLRPGATLAMRRLCEQLKRQFPGLAAQPMSARYADRIPPADLQGEGAVVVSREALSSPRTTTIVPMFLGPSDTVSKALQPLASSRILVTQSLVDFDTPHESCFITQCLVRAYLRLPVPRPVHVVLVDHGSPSRQVTRVRRALAARLRLALLPHAVREVVDCSMERRPGEEYAFNDPLLENVFDGLLEMDDNFALLPAFLFPGNHAGEDGDLAQILRGPVKTKHPNLTITMAELIGAEHNDDLLLELIASRINHAIASYPFRLILAQYHMATTKSTPPPSIRPTR